MELEEELRNLAPQPEVQVWIADDTGELRLVLAESGAQHDARLQADAIWAVSLEHERRLAGDHGGKSMGEMLEMLGIDPPSEDKPWEDQPPSA